LCDECCGKELFVTPILFMPEFTKPGCEAVLLIKLVDATLQVKGELEVDNGIDD
jgi:hypothetical protein